MSSVLVVDDDRHIRTGLALLIGSHGHAASTASTVREGLEKVEAGPTHLLLDLNLPDGLGTTVLRHVRTANLPVQVAVLSGSADPRLKAEVDALQPDAVFRKPPDLDALMDWIASSQRAVATGLTGSDRVASGCGTPSRYAPTYLAHRERPRRDTGFQPVRAKPGVGQIGKHRH